MTHHLGNYKDLKLQVGTRPTEDIFTPGLQTQGTPVGSSRKCCHFEFETQTRLAQFLESVGPFLIMYTTYCHYIASCA